MNSLVAEPVAVITPAAPDAADAAPAAAAAGVTATISPPHPVTGIRPSIGPLDPPRSDLERMLRRCDRLRLR